MPQSDCVRRWRRADLLLSFCVANREVCADFVDLSAGMAELCAAKS